MAKANYGFVTAGGLAGVRRGIQEELAARVEAQQTAHKQMVEEAKLAMEFDRNRLERDKFGETVRTGNLDRPTQIALRQAQVDDLVRKPGESLLAHERRLAEAVQQNEFQTAQDTRKNTFSLGELKQKNEYELGQIAARGAEQRKTDSADPSKSGSAETAKIAAKAQEEYRALNTIESLVGEINTIGAKTNWSGVGGLGQGSASQWLKKNLGVGSDEAQALRANIGNLRSSVSGARAGLTLTPNEERMLDTFIGTIDSHPDLIQANMKELMKWVAVRRASNAHLYKDPSLADSVSTLPGTGGAPGTTFTRDPRTGKLTPAR